MLSAYTQQLRDPRWQRKRLETLNAAGWRCERCGETQLELHVHHPEYRAGAAPWEYDRELEELQVLCCHCHATHHGRAIAPAGTLSRKRDAWELAASYHLAAAILAADFAAPPGSAWQRIKAIALAASDGHDLAALERLELA